jgi:hypothetical protein
MLVLASIANPFPRPSPVGPGKQNFPLPSRAPWPLAYEAMISRRGVAKKRRAQELAAMTVKSSVGVAARTQSWPGGNHVCVRCTATHNHLSGSQTLLLPAGCNRQLVGRPNTRPLAPADIRLLDTLSRSRRALRPRFARNFPYPPNRGRREAGRPMRPIAACARVVVERTRVSQVTPASPGTPRAMVYGL